MSKYSICALDKEIHKNKTVGYSTALRHVETYIIKHIDPQFSVVEFRKWLDSDSDQPFKWGSNKYVWEDK